MRKSPFFNFHFSNKKDDVVGTMIYTLDGTEIGRSDIVAKSSVKKAGFFDYLKKAMTELLIGGKK